MALLCNITKWPVCLSSKKLSRYSFTVEIFLSFASFQRSRERQMCAHRSVEADKRLISEITFFSGSTSQISRGSTMRNKYSYQTRHIHIHWTQWAEYADRIAQIELQKVTASNDLIEHRTVSMRPSHLSDQCLDNVLRNAILRIDESALYFDRLWTY